MKSFLIKCFLFLWGFCLLFPPAAMLPARAEETAEEMAEETAEELTGETDVLSGSLPMLVNKEYTVGEDFVPADLISLNALCEGTAIRVKYEDTRAVREAAEALIRMLEDAAEEGLKKWQISAAWRSYTDQERMLNRKINSYLQKHSRWSRSKARSAALKTVAPPGASEHHLGLAFDINVRGAAAFSSTRQYTWLKKNCWRYGFILRYPKEKEKITGYTAEAWHYRYVGEAHALRIREEGLVLEEYLQKIENGEITPPLPELEELVDLDAG